jgi:hypothetical protein
VPFSRCLTLASIPRLRLPASSSRAPIFGKAPLIDRLAGSPANTPWAINVEAIRPRPAPKRRVKNPSIDSSSPGGGVLIHGSRIALNLEPNESKPEKAMAGDSGIW